jgi:hypothetical protein
MRAFSIIFALFLVLGFGLDLRHTRESWSWQPRQVRISKCQVEPTPDGKFGYLDIEIWDIADKREVKHVKAHFGPSTLMYYWPGQGFTTADEARFPAGTEMIAYRNPENHDKYILEQTNLSWIAITLGTASVVWIGWNVFRKVRSLRTPGAEVPETHAAS